MKKLFLLAILAFSLNGFSQVPPYVSTSGLIGWWPFTGNANDLSVNANNGTITSGVTLTTDRFSNLNSAYSFDGNGDYIDCGNSASVNFTGSHTISAWLYASDLSFPRGIVSKSAIGNAYALVAGPYILSDLNFLGLNTGYLVPTLNWVHVVSVFDSTARTISLYTNGVLYGTQSVSYDSISISPDNLYLGSHRPTFTPDWTWSGKLDDIGLWNRPLTQIEITALYLSSNVGINDKYSKVDFSVFPNPANDLITVKVNSINIGSTYIITDALGKTVASGKLTAESSSINISELSAGIYMFKVSEQNQHSFKVVKLK